MATEEKGDEAMSGLKFGDDPDIDDDYYRVEKVVVSTTVWKEMKA